MNEELIRDTYLSRNKVKTLKHAEEVAETAAWLAEKTPQEALNA